MQIFVKFGRKTITLDVEPSTTIKEIKEMILDRIEINKMSHYELKFHNEYLQDQLMLADYKIYKESTIDLNSINPFRLRSRLNIKFKNEILHMEFTCFCCYSILDYKREIFNRRGYPIDCQLLYSDEKGNNILNDDDYESIPILLKIDENKIKKGYNVKYFDGVTENNIISGYDMENIGQIKKKIEENYKLPYGSFELVYDYNILNDDKTLGDYDIYYQSKIKLIVQQKYENLLFMGYVLVYYKGKAYTVGLGGKNILDVKKYFNEVLFNNTIELDKIKISFRGIMLDDYLDLKKENLYQRELELFVKND